MPPSSNIVLITGSAARHRYFVDCLNAKFRIAAVWTEAFPYPAPVFASREEREAWDWYFSRREAHEARILKSGRMGPALNEPERHALTSGELNAPQTLEAVAALQPGFIALFGTSLVGPAFRHRFPDRIHNLHVGRPAHYRGSSCNFWPIHDSRLECLGASVHRVDAGIDTGAVLAESAIALEESDDEQTLSAKPWVRGTELMAEVIAQWLTGKTLNALPQSAKGRLCRMQDFTPQAVLKVRRRVESGGLKQEIAACLRAGKAD